jgi:imidazolonepropionase
MNCLITHIGNLYTPHPGLPYGQFEHLKNCQIFIHEGVITDIFQMNQTLPDVDEVIDVKGGTVMPGFVDAHTHPVFWRTREEEFQMRIQGKSYEEIAEAGGGIRNSVRQFRETSKADIKSITKTRISRFLEYGTTTIEAKSGYGLSTEDEIKSLEIIKELNEEQDLELIPTFLGAHEIPDEYQDNREKYIELIIKEMIPIISQKELAKFCDVFCEKNVFTIEESRQILETGKSHGLNPKLHADELYAFGGAELAAEVRAVSADHLVHISENGIRELASMQVIPVLLPGTTFFLGKNQYAPARKMLNAGCQVAISTDYNPGSSTTQNLQLMWTLGALKLSMSSGEMLWATTLTAAKAIQMDHALGSIEIGKQADLVLLDIPNLDYFAYHYGVNHVLLTLKKGHVVYSSPRYKSLMEGQDGENG